MADAYRKLRKVTGKNDILNQILHVSNHLGKLSAETRNIDGLAQTGALLLDLANLYSTRQEEVDSDVSSDTELSADQTGPSMGFRVEGLS